MDASEGGLCLSEVLIVASNFFSTFVLRLRLVFFLLPLLLLGLDLVVVASGRAEVIGSRQRDGGGRDARFATLRGSVAVQVVEDAAADGATGLVEVVVDGVGVQRDTGAGRLNTTSLGESEVPALPHDPAPQISTIDPDAVVGPVADIGVGLRK